MTHRMFVAALPPEEVVDDLDAFLDVRREAGEFRWTLPEHWHLTLAFLPAMPDRALEELVDLLDEAAARHRPLSAAVAGGGAFPGVADARVLWAGVETEDPDALASLARNTRTAATRAGIETPRERFHPHLTLARARRPFEATRWLRVLEGYRSPTFVIDRIALVASHLGEGPRKRPRYEVLGEFELTHG